jgi:PAS domain S-box-containing protein
VFHDFTDRKKKAEEEIKFSEEKYKNLFENAPDVIVTIDLTGKITSVNKAIMQHGFRENEIVGSDIFKLVPIEYNQKMLTGLKNIAAGNPSQGEIEILTPNGKRRAEYNSNSIWLNGKVVGYQTIIRDVTERKKAEEALRESEEKHRKLFEESMDAIIIADVATGIIVDCNPAASKLVGRQKSELVGQHQSIIHPKEQMEGEFTGGFKQHLENQTKTHETQIMLKTGEIRDATVKGTMFELKGKKLIQGIFKDITERKQSAQKLREAEKRYHALFNQAPLGVMVIDPQTAKPIEFNDAAHTQLGYSREEFSKLCLSDLGVKENADEIKAHLAKIVREGGEEFETKPHTKNGEIRNVLVNTKVVELAGKTFLFSVFHDITEIRKAQDALMKSESQYRQLVNVAQEGIWVLDNNYRTVFVNPRMAKMLGYAESEIVGKSLFDFLFKTDVEQATQYLSQFKQGVEGTFEYEFTRKDGSRVNTSIAAAQIRDDEGNCSGTLSLVSDITLRKKMENQLKQETEKLETITESIGVGLTITSKDYHILWTNKVMKQIRGIPDLEGRTCYATYNYLDTVCPECGVKKVFEGKESDSREFMVVDREKGSTVWAQLIATPIKDKDGNVTSALELVLPITERKKVESSLKSSEEKFRNLAEQSPNIIFINQKGKVVYANTEAEKATGYKKEEFYSPKFNFMDLIAPESKEFVKSQFIKHMKGEDVHQYEYKLISKKGQTKDVINNPKVIDYNGEPAILGIVTDISEINSLKEKIAQYSRHLEDLVKEKTVQLEQAQAQLVKSERLAAIGELAGMVGHDLRNPLTGIKNAAYYLKKKGATCPEGQAKEMLEIIDKAIDHSNKIINDLLDYSREMHLELTECTPHTLLDDAVRMIQVPDRVQIVNHVLEESQVRVDADKMMRVFINLIKNAIDAMPEEGTLEITSRQTRDNLEIAFADTGMGIPDEVLPKIFSPLFTTKAQGMGFGLAICKRIIESHGGTITVKTAVNKGTAFTITLPIKPKLEVGGEKTWINMPESLLSTTTRA